MKVHKFLYGVVIILLVVGIWNYISFLNKNITYEQLDKSDQEIIKKYNQFYIEESKKTIWQGFSLGDKTILAINKESRKAFLINPSKKPTGLFAKRIRLGEEFEIEVYQVYSFYPKMLRFVFDGNFNTIDKKYSIFGNEVYYIKYDNSSSIDKKYTSLHFITFLSHESFRYYMQDGWKETKSASENVLGEVEIALIEQEYNVLSKIQEMFNDQRIEKELLLDYTKRYVKIIEQRIANHRDYVEAELQKETMEETATYVGIKASEYVGYDYGVMYFDNRKDVIFSEVVPTIRSGELKNSFLYTRMPYETGAMLCLIMDALQIPDWQKKVNSKEVDPSITLYSVIKDFVKSDQR